MSWEERLKEKIEFVSPQRKTFSAFWSGDDQEKEKMIGIFKYPKVRGVIAQDMDIGGTSYPLNFWFSGSDHDKLGQAFFQACDEEGLWTITHPTDGVKELQLLKVRRSVQPTSSANMTIFSTEWLETIDKSAIVSVVQGEETIRNQSNIVNEAGGAVFENLILLDNASLRNSTVAASQSLLDKIRGHLARLYELNAQINNYVNSVQRSIQAALNEVELPIASIASSFQEIIQLPIRATNNISSRLSALQDLLTSIFDLSPDTPYAESRNIVGVMELGVTSLLTASAQAVVGGDLRTRREAIETADIISQLFANGVDGLDALQTVFEDQRTTRQYFSQSGTFGDLSILTAQAVSLTIQTAFDLSVEKRFILDKPRAAIEIALTEYGDLGDQDELFDFFVETNKLVGSETLLLPVGKEIVIYV